MISWKQYIKIIKKEFLSIEQDDREKLYKNLDIIFNSLPIKNNKDSIIGTLNDDHKYLLKL